MTKNLKGVLGTKLGMTQVWDADWDRNGTVPPPPLPDEVVEQTRAKYIEAYERLTGRTWA